MSVSGRTGTSFILCVRYSAFGGGGGIKEVRESRRECSGCVGRDDTKGKGLT